MVPAAAPPNPRVLPFARPSHDDRTPGGYMRRCRQRAQVTISEAAAAITLHPIEHHTATRDLTALEANVPGDYGRLVDALRIHRVFPFDMATFTSLAAATTRRDPDAQPAKDWEA